VGEKIKVRVIEVDLERKRIALTAKKGGAAPGQGPRPGLQSGVQSGGARPGPSGGRPPPGGGRPPQGGGGGGKPQQGGAKPQQGEGFRNNPFADLLRKGSPPS
jgi:uncharacterized protein